MFIVIGIMFFTCMSIYIYICTYSYYMCMYIHYTLGYVIYNYDINISFILSINYVYYDSTRYRHITVELLSNQLARSFVVVYDFRHK